VAGGALVAGSTGGHDLPWHATRRRLPRRHPAPGDGNGAGAEAPAPLSVLIRRSRLPADRATGRAAGPAEASTVGAGAARPCGLRVRDVDREPPAAEGLVAELRDADLVFTGEGRLDEQSAYGKAPAGVAKEAKKLGLPVIALVGSLGKGYESIYQSGVDSVLTITQGPISLEEAMANAEALITDAAERAMRLFLAGRLSA